MLICWSTQNREAKDLKFCGLWGLMGCLRSRLGQSMYCVRLLPGGEKYQCASKLAVSVVVLLIGGARFRLP